MIELIASMALAILGDNCPDCDPLPVGSGGCVNGTLDIDPEFGDATLEVGEVVEASAIAGSLDCFCIEIQCFDEVILTTPDGVEHEAEWLVDCNEGCDTFNQTEPIPYEITQADANEGSAVWLISIRYTDGDIVTLGWGGTVIQPEQICGDINGDG